MDYEQMKLMASEIYGNFRQKQKEAEVAQQRKLDTEDSEHIRK